jgi:hypothetical protein
MEIVADDCSVYPPYYNYIFHMASFDTDILAATANHLVQDTYK